jgi:type III secretion inner rod protein HrpB2
MIAAIPPIPPVAPAAGPTGVAATTATAAPVAPPEPALVDRFTALMREVGHGPAGRVHSHGPSQLHRMIDDQDLAAKATFDNVHALSISGLGSGPEAAATIMQMQSEMAMLSFKLNMVNTVAESGKSAVQTLMKNQ